MKNQVSTTHFLQLLHTVFVGPMQTRRLSGEKNMLVIVDDYSRLICGSFSSTQELHFRSLRETK